MTVGRLPDGTQLLASVVRAGRGGECPDPAGDRQRTRRWQAVVHRFDAQGGHAGSTFREVGDFEGVGLVALRAWKVETAHAALAAEGELESCDIWVRLFSVVIDGVPHGLTYAHHTYEFECVYLEPQDVTFYPPWDSREYLT